VVHGSDWRKHFEKLKSHLKIAYVKDVKLGGGWVPFGEGELARTGYFKALKNLNYQAPVSLHIEFNWDEKGSNRTRGALVQALKQSASVLRGWMAEA
jgi:sugar phosphate isomerase/epimerase